MSRKTEYVLAAAGLIRRYWITLLLGARRCWPWRSLTEICFNTWPV